MKNELQNLEETRLIYERDKKILENKTDKDKINELLNIILNQKVILYSGRKIKFFFIRTRI